MNTNQEYYNFMNLSSYLKKTLLKGSYTPDYIRWFKNIASVSISMFSYENLPNGLTSEILEKALMFNNNLCFYNSKKYGIILCRYLCGGDYDLYWKPVKVNLLSLNGKPIEYNVPYQDIVLVRDNCYDIPTFLTINSWIDKIIEKERTLDILIQLTRLPTILTGTKEQTAGLKQLLQKIGNFEPFAIANKGYEEKIEQFDIKLPVDLKSIYELMDKYKDLANASIGLYSTDEKRERIVTAEIQANNDEVDFIYNERYEQRKLFVDEINKRYGLNVILKESYVNNREDEIKLLSEQVKAEENAKANAEIKVEEVKNTTDGGNENE